MLFVDCFYPRVFFHLPTSDVVKTVEDATDIMIVSRFGGLSLSLRNKLDSIMLSEVKGNYSNCTTHHTPQHTPHTTHHSTHHTPHTTAHTTHHTPQHTAHTTHHSTHHTPQHYLQWWFSFTVPSDLRATVTITTKLILVEARYVRMYVLSCVGEYSSQWVGTPVSGWVLQ